MTEASETAKQGLLLPPATQKWHTTGAEAKMSDNTRARKAPHQTIQIMISSLPLHSMELFGITANGLNGHAAYVNIWMSLAGDIKRHTKQSIALAEDCNAAIQSRFSRWNVQPPSIPGEQPKNMNKNLGLTVIKLCLFSQVYRQLNPHKCSLSAYINKIEAGNNTRSDGSHYTFHFNCQKCV